MSNYAKMKNYKGFDENCCDVKLYLTYDNYIKNWTPDGEKKNVEEFVYLFDAVRRPWSSCHRDPECREKVYIGVN